VLTFYDIIPIAYPEYVAWRARWLFRAATRLACAAAQRIVAISAAAQGDLLAHFAVDPAKVTVTPLAPDARFRPQPRVEVERVRTKYNLPEPFFLYFGINKPHKNLTTLIDAYSQLQNAQSGLAAFPALVIAGAWDKRYPEAKEDAATLGLGDTVHFLGRIDDDDLPALYTAATVFVFPSRYEGFGLPVLEAMACGTPVACSNASSLPEVAGDAALLFAPTDTSAIAQAIQRLTDDASLRADLRQRGLRQAARFTWRRTAELTLAVYRDALHLD
jgi:alpha-1,3-rhamnosyl/mannosyltransferase